MRSWDRDYRGRAATFAIHPLGVAPTEKRPGRSAFDTPLNRIVIDW